MNKIGETGATSLSELLKSNTTLTELQLSRENKRRHTQIHPLTNHFLSLFHQTGSIIGERGATSLSELLKSNTTLTALDLFGEYKKRIHTKDAHKQITLFHFSSYQQGIALKTREQRH